jgi:CheY-like chemotaxis protein
MVDPHGKTLPPPPGVTVIPDGGVSADGVHDAFPSRQPSLHDPALLYAQEYRGVQDQLASIMGKLDELLPLVDALGTRMTRVESRFDGVDTTMSDVKSHIAAREAEGKGYRNGCAGRRLLLVEDEPDLRTVLVREFGNCGVIIAEARTAEQAEELLSEMDPGYLDAALIDMHLPRGRSGYDLASIVRDTQPQARVVLHSGYPLDLREAQALGAIAAAKPASFSTLKALLFPG